MTSQGTLMGRLRVSASHSRFRWLVYGILTLAFALLSLFPQPYLARARIIPQDTASAAGTTALLTLIAGQSQSVQSLLGGGRASNDLYLIIARSDSVVRRVIAELKMVGPGRYDNVSVAKRALERKIDVVLLLGGVIEIEAKTHDPAESHRLTEAYVNALSKELASFGEQIIVNKQRIIQRRFGNAEQRVAETERALNAFRRANNLASPEQQLGAALALRTDLQTRLQAKLVELRTVQQFSGPESPALRSVQAEIASLQQQIGRTATPSTGSGGPNLAGAGDLETRYLSFYRDYRLAQSLYDIYARSSEQVAVDQLAAESASYVQIIDPAYVDVDRQFNVWALAAMATILLLAAFTEIYGPSTGLFDLRDLRKYDEPLA